LKRFLSAAILAAFCLSLPTTAQAAYVALPAKGIFYYPWYSTSMGGTCTLAPGTTCTPQAGWNQSGLNPFTQYHPAAGFYDSGSTTTINSHQSQIKKTGTAGQDVAILSWFGQGHLTDTNVGKWFDQWESSSSGTPPVDTSDPQTVLYYECEGNTKNTSESRCTGNPDSAPAGETATDPSIAQIRNDLNYIWDHYAQPNGSGGYGYTSSQGAYGGIKPIIFVYGDSEDGDVSAGEDPVTELNEGCDMVKRWNRANSLADEHFYIVLKVFPSFTSCGSVPLDPSTTEYSDSRRVDSWHQYAPANRIQTVARLSGNPYSVTISPGFRRADDDWPTGGTDCAGGTCPYLERNIADWTNAIFSMKNSGADWQLTTTFNEWGEGSSIENAWEWTEVGDGNASLYMRELKQADGIPPTNRGKFYQAAGDIALNNPCSAGVPTDPGCWDNETAQHFFTGALGGAFSMGDNQYNEGTLTQYMNNYGQTGTDGSWGRFQAAINPAPGNHDPFGPQSATEVDSGYDTYWSTPPVSGTNRYYSVNPLSAPDWHIISLDACGIDQDRYDCGFGEVSTRTDCTAPPTPPPCGHPLTDDVMQLNWLKNDIAANTRPCVLAIWHHPRWSNGMGHGDNNIVDPFWQRLANLDEFGDEADIILNGHEHSYERMPPIDANGQIQEAGGMREFVVGTGGTDAFHSFNNNSVIGTTDAQFGNTTGVLRLNLDPSDLASPGYAWRFVPNPQRVQPSPLTVNSDSGSDTCN
jgi:hypothetical protein